MANKRKSVKVGAVLRNEDDKPPYIKLGSKSNKAEYNYSVQITVRDGTGKVVADQTDGFLSLFDPRKGTFLTDEQKDRLSPKLKSEIVLYME